MLEQGQAPRRQPCRTRRVPTCRCQAVWRGTWVATRRCHAAENTPRSRAYRPTSADDESAHNASSHARFHRRRRQYRKQHDTIRYDTIREAVLT